MGDVLRPDFPEIRRHDGGHLPPVGPGGTSGDMDARIKRLEDDYKELRSDLKTLLVDVAVLKERVSHLPSKEFIVKSISATLAILSSLIIFQTKLQALLGLAHP